MVNWKRRQDANRRRRKLEKIRSRILKQATAQGYVVSDDELRRLTAEEITGAIHVPSDA
jgi:hypothetical protein